MKRSSKVQVLGIVGLCIALYACEVEAHMDDVDYEALCDIAASFSCTEVFKSSCAPLCQLTRHCTSSHAAVPAHVHAAPSTRAPCAWQTGTSFPIGASCPRATCLMSRSP